MCRKLQVTNEQIQEAIESSESLQEAAQKLGKSTGYVSSRACGLRKSGIVLEKFKTGKKAAQVAA